MTLKEYQSVHFLVNRYDSESVEEFVFILSFILGLSNSFDDYTKSEIQIFLSDLRSFMYFLEAELDEESKL